jgi:CIC family chloride channel protein
LGYASFLTHPLFFMLGAFAGFLGVAYNRALLAAVAGVERLRRVPVELQAGLIGGAVGVLAWVAPNLVGGGDGLTQRALNGEDGVAIVLVVFSIRFVLSILSYTAAVPGGIFAPLLVLGAQLGLVFGELCQFAFPSLGIQREAFALVGMAAFFIAVVRAPVTGIVLVTEMTANVTMLLPMLGAGFIAMLVPTLLRNMPIYDSLRAGTLRREQASGLSQTAAVKSRRL